MTHTVLPPYVTHSILQAALEKIDDAGLKAALSQTWVESKFGYETKKIRFLQETIQPGLAV